MVQRQFLPRYPAVTEVDDGNVGEPQGRHQRFEMMMTVDDVGPSTETRKIIDHGNRCPAEFFSDGPQYQAEGDRMVSST
jgi:hypothetical protein